METSGSYFFGKYEAGGKRGGSCRKLTEDGVVGERRGDYN